MTPCIPGQGHVQRGYVHTSRGLAHRVAWEAVHGPIPEGMQVDHLCHDPKTCVGGDTCPHRNCVNVEHLGLATNQQNCLRGNTIPAKWAARTACEDCGGPLTEVPRGRTCIPCRSRKAVAGRRLRREKTGAMG